MNRRELIKILGVAPLLKVAMPAVNQPLREPEENTVHLLVYGATPGGVACAVRAAREGWKVILVNPLQHLGGMFASGLGIMDTLYNGSRAPLYDEFRKSIYDYYRNKYGTGSAQYEASGPGISKTKYEAHVAEKLINDLLAAELRIQVVKEYYPASVEKDGRVIKRVTFHSPGGQAPFTTGAKIFADCSYEGDLLALAGAAYQLGRESKKQYGEKYAGVIFSKDIKISEAPNEISEEHAGIMRRLNLYRYKETRTKIFLPESTGEADPAVQAFNLRSIITDNQENRLLPEKPEGYDPEHFKKKYNHRIENLTLSRPNRKTSLNYPKILGLQNKYVEGGWKERKEVMEQYYRELLGLLYFRQNDPSLPAEVREHWRKYGLAKDEFTDNNHLPYELYVREGRRLKGKKVFTEHDAMLAPGMQRAPVHTDSIGITEWFLDSHACTERHVGDSKEEGEIMLKSETVPGQIPLATIFSQQHDNLLVPVCLSASHIGWGAIRLEPVWMGIGEVAGYIVAEACARNIRPMDVDEDQLTRKLASLRFMITFYNDMEGRESAAWYPAVQYLGTKGFFTDYEARPDDKLSRMLALRWAGLVKQWRDKKSWTVQQEALSYSTDVENSTINVAEFASTIEKAIGVAGKADAWLRSLQLTRVNAITRGQAAQLIMEATASVK